MLCKRVCVCYSLLQSKPKTFVFDSHTLVTNLVSNTSLCSV
jgi:hypothetical protein